MHNGVCRKAREDEELLQQISDLQTEMREGKPLRLLEDTGQQRSTQPVDSGKCAWDFGRKVMRDGFALQQSRKKQIVSPMNIVRLFSSIKRSHGLRTNQENARREAFEAS